MPSTLQPCRYTPPKASKRIMHNKRLLWSLFSTDQKDYLLIKALYSISNSSSSISSLGGGTYGSNSVTVGFGSYCNIFAALSNSSRKILMVNLSTTLPRSWEVSKGSSMHIKCRSFPMRRVQSLECLLKVWQKPKERKNQWKCSFNVIKWIQYMSFMLSDFS